tara:strand:- start:2505 stop:3299 length:795 start_codon:yes stop_codon:yes gene_type:complete
MTTLFIYGDSFGADWNANWQWHRQLVAMLNTNGKGITRVVNQSVSGCSNDYSFDLFSRDRQKPGDVVLFLLTEPSRQTFWMEKPHVGNLRSITDTDTAVELKKLDEQKYRAALDYWTYLDDFHINYLRLQQLIYSLRVLQIERELMFQMIPCFDMDLDWTDQVEVIGSLTQTVCDGEFVSEKDMLEWYSTSIDTRANHMVANNHTVLANKVFDALMFKKTIDLTQDFEKAFLTNIQKLNHDGLLPELVEKAKGPGNTLPKECFS